MSGLQKLFSKPAAKPASPAKKQGAITALPFALPKFGSAKKAAAPAKAAKAKKGAAAAKKGSIGLYARRETELKPQEAGVGFFDKGVGPTGFGAFGFGVKEISEEERGPWFLPGYKGDAFKKTGTKKMRK